MDRDVVLVRLGSLFGLLAAASFITMLTIVGVLQPRFWRPWTAISDMGMGRGPLALAVNRFLFELPGFALAAFAASLRWRRPPLSLAGTLTTALGGVAFAAAGLVPFPRPAHYVFSVTAPLLIGGGIWMLSAGPDSRASLGVASWFGRLVAVAVLLHLLLIIGALILFRGFDLEPGGVLNYVGHYQKVSLLFAWAWIVAVAWTGLRRVRTRVAATA